MTDASMRTTNCALHRLGKASGAIAIGLFLLSCVAVGVLLQVSSGNLQGQLGSPEYVWKSEHAASTTDAYGSLADSAAISWQATGTIANQEDGLNGSVELKLRDWHYVEDLGAEIAQFETVFWEPNDTDSLRSYLRENGQVAGGFILEIGTGTGLVALYCAQLGAATVVASDINPAAVANAAYNAEQLELSNLIEFRLVRPEEPEPFSIVRDDERFDLIVSNPPWEDAEVSEIAAHALYDPELALLNALLAQAADYLKPGGRLLLAYGAKQAVSYILDTAPRHGWEVRLEDGRVLSELPEVFLPGMLLVLTKP